MNQKYPYAALLTVLFLWPILVSAQPSNKEIVAIVKPTEDFTLTGDGKAEPWAKAEWIKLTKRKGSVDYTSSFKLLYSDKGIYCLFYFEDPIITASFTEDFSNLWTEDVAEIFFWTNESAPIYFEYEISPLNHELPILVPNFDGDFLGWRPWHYDGDRRTRHEASIQRDTAGKPKSWIAEVFIPYALLKPLVNVPPRAGATWRMNAYRVDHDAGYTGWSWVPVDTNFHDYERYGTIRFE